MMRKILLTGASGLLGSHLVRLFNGTADVHVWRGDLSQGIDAASLPSRLDAVVHLAQSRRYRDFPDSAGHVARVNALAPVDLAQHALRSGATHFVYASTGSVYAPSADPLTEDAPLADSESMSFYAATKYAGERLLAPFASRLNLIILRPFFIYGAGQDRSMVLPRLADSVASGIPISLAGPDGIRINPVHADDAALAVETALGLTGSHRINVAGPDTLSLREIVEELGRRLGKQPVLEVDHSSSRADLIGDISVMGRLLHTPRERFFDRINEVLQ